MNTKEVLNNLVDYYHENKISHAYLLEVNNIEQCMIDLKNIIKQICCTSSYTTNCNKCNICNLIDQNYLPSLKIVEPQGTMIKKEQIIELKKLFSEKPIYTKDNIYIIKNAEKLNGTSANTMLKFLEEPEDNIIGFFITNNVNNVISTIKSRCEILRLNYNIEQIDINKELLDISILYLNKIEIEKTKGIMYNRDIILSKYSEREDILKIFKIILMIYEDTLYNKCKYIKLNLSNQGILKRINLVCSIIDEINSNANIELLLDKFVIKLGEINE